MPWLVIRSTRVPFRDLAFELVGDGVVALVEDPPLPRGGLGSAALRGTWFCFLGISVCGLISGCGEPAGRHRPSHPLILPVSRMFDDSSDAGFTGDAARASVPEDGVVGSGAMTGTAAGWRVRKGLLSGHPLGGWAPIVGRHRRRRAGLCRRRSCGR